MTTSAKNHDDLKSAVCVKEMASMCGLSRQRFAQLVKAGVFPAPLYDVSSRRPLYPEDLQKVCLEVRRRNFGINGKPILFYARRIGPAVTTSKANKKAPPTRNSTAVMDGLKALGITVTADQLAEAMKETFPAGTVNIDQSEVIRAVFMHLRRKNTGVNVGSN